MATVDRPRSMAARCWLLLAGGALAGRVDWVRHRSPRPIRWLLANHERIMTVAWLLVLLVAGHARIALAAGDPIIGGPDLAHGAGNTLFETYGVFDYNVTIKPDDRHTGTLDIQKSLLAVLNVIVDLFLWIGLGILYGVLTLLEWFLDLTIYHDSASQIDAAVRMIANHVFWPMISASVAVGAFMVYAKWRGEGQGFASDLGWVCAAAVLGIVFASGPSAIMGAVDDLRQTLGGGIIAGSSDYLHVADNPTGFPTPPIGGTPQDAATRKLVDGLWNSFGANYWCYVEFHELPICKVAGFHALANDDTWKGWMGVLDGNGFVTEFGKYGDWIRGQDLGRIGMALMLLVLVLPMGLLLGKIIINGLTALIGFLLMLVVGLVFLTLWPIPGLTRQIGVKFWIKTVGQEVEVLFVTVTLSGVMVVVAVLSTQTGKYGFFLVSVLNLVLMWAAVKVQSWLEMLMGYGGGSSMGLGTFLILRAVTRSVVGGVAGMLGGAGRAATGVASAVGQAGTVRVGGGLPVPRVRGSGRLSGLSHNFSGVGTNTRLRPGPTPTLRKRALPATATHVPSDPELSIPQRSALRPGFTRTTSADGSATGTRRVWVGGSDGLSASAPRAWPTTRMDATGTTTSRTSTRGISSGKPTAAARGGEVIGEQPLRRRLWVAGLTGVSAPSTTTPLRPAGRREDGTPVITTAPQWRITGRPRTPDS